MNLNNISIVLVESQGAGNIGSVCRAMMNFGFSDLRLVNPAVDHRSEEARRMAMKAGGLLTSARIFGTLTEALADCHYSLATTRRLGKYRRDYFLPDQAAEKFLPYASEGRVALVFGREDSGLSTSDLLICQGFISIPTRDALPSMNLAQAVSLCLYEMEKAQRQADGRVPKRKKPATGERLAGMYRHMCRTLLSIGYLDRHNPEHILQNYRRIFGRAGLDDREVGLLHALFSRIDGAGSTREKPECHDEKGEHEEENR